MELCVPYLTRSRRRSSRAAFSNSSVFEEVIRRKSVDFLPSAKVKFLLLPDGYETDGVIATALLQGPAVSVSNDRDAALFFGATASGARRHIRLRSSPASPCLVISPEQPSALAALHDAAARAAQDRISRRTGTTAAAAAVVAKYKAAPLTGVVRAVHSFPSCYFVLTFLSGRTHGCRCASEAQTRPEASQHAQIAAVCRQTPGPSFFYRGHCEQVIPFLFFYTDTRELFNESARHARAPVPRISHWRHDDFGTVCVAGHGPVI